ncbi:hypothetical protein [Dysgonomonas sp. 520]|uniref:hypothetical protein n=1 Tax=Dysgonomonas sp. 520 TaxID=2302931 RepID=UPI0013D4B02E|nr:hypothetical protein [Dysgonomonas sp. 520]NDW09771.1 hypothetical protein [Dysgonomonas sp. 520]
MKWWNSKIRVFLLTVVLCLSFVTQANAQSEYERRMYNYQTRWSKLIPKYTKVQFAGGMGFLSLGGGWNYGKNKQWETDVLFGFIPRYSDEKVRATFTLKQNFIPWNVKLGKDFSMDPLSCSLYANSVLDGDYWASAPDKYPNGYYSFSTKIRFNMALGQRFTYHFPVDKRRTRKSVTFFYEIGTNELYLISAFCNSYLKPNDYLHLSLGLKVQIL